MPLHSVPEKMQKQFKNKPITVRIAGWSARHRWLVFGLWFVLIVSLFGGAYVVPASNVAKQDNAGSDLEFVKAYNALKADGGQTDLGEDFFLIVNSTTLKATDPAFQEVVTKMADTLTGYSYTDSGATRPFFSRVANPYKAPPESGLISTDNTTVRIYARIPGDNTTQVFWDRMKIFHPKLEDLKKDYPGYKILLSNNTLNALSNSSAANESMNRSMFITLIPTFLILLVVFGAVVIAIVPLVLAITSIIGAVGVVTFYGKVSGETQITTAIILVVIMGLAVAVDYSLFVISRYRTERRKGSDKLTAIEAACATAGRAVFFSGLLVAVSISGLFILGGQLTSMAIGMIAVVLVSVLGSFTFLPAILSILGNGINWGRLPYFGRDRVEGKSLWSKVVRAVMQLPILTTLVAAALLLILATPLLHLRIGEVKSSEETLEGVQATNLMNEKWPQGTELKLQVVVTKAKQPETLAAIQQFEAAALRLPGLSGPVQRIPSTDGNVLMLSFYQAGGLNDQANFDLVNKLRKEIVPLYFKDLQGVNAYVTGSTPYGMDLSSYFTNPVVWFFVLGLSFLVLLLVFRSLVIATKAIILNLLSTGAAYGAVVWVFQDGNLGAKTTGVLMFWLPVFIFTIIFGLSMDYHLFILTRVKELRDKGQATVEAVANAISTTSGTITGAALIMLVVFGDFYLGISDPAIRQLGLGLAVAVFVDATLVRCLLLPALMKLLGDWNWWLPGFLNWLPEITIEANEEAEIEAVAA
ncbi:MAG: MMPL family transporter [Chloroflexi bacterium]|uniref:MMPL family transporter n=1 Tax=Candidatus Chlorohelix allophototropha TaxID=3003348 RepID=A0A8T7M3W6_9CHLR|nr:MMPL family transporter [Chloroflexota bacterium]WJW70233.1 MMPL family transporter [Chloroflexota bacterium L227-S17]